MKSIAIRPDLTVEGLAELFLYHPRSGLLTWRKSPSKIRGTAGATVGQVQGNYRILVHNGKCYPVHRLIWAMHNGRWPAKLVDHIDGNGLNNRLENLREATHAQNSQNQRRQKKSKSGFKGVTWAKGMGKWEARIMANGKSRHLGYFDDAAEAGAAYDAAATKLHKEFARTNADMAPKPRHYLTGETDVQMFNPRHWLIDSTGAYS